MSGIFIGNATKIFYNTDAGNNIPNAPTYVNIDELAAFPEVKIQSSMSEYETYNDEYSVILASNKTIQSLNIVVNYVPDNVTHVFLDSMFNSKKKFQIKVSLYESLTSVIQYYAILSGYVSTATLSGDQNSVVKKSYVFTAEDVIARGTITDMADLKLGDYGVGANGVDIPQYESPTPSGNSFLKVPASQALNPTGTDLLGIANVDNGNTTKLVMTESGTFSIYGKNQSTSWTQILTKPQSDSAYVPMARTVNGKALSTNITLTPADVSALALSGGTLTGNLNGTTATFSGAVNTGNLTAGAISGTTGTFTGAVQGPSAAITGAVSADTITLQTKATTKDLTVTGDIQAVTATLTGALTAGATTLSGALTGTTATFSGSLAASILSLTTPLSTANGGTGNANGTVARLTTPRSFQTNLGSTSAITFDGTANVSLGVTGILPIANGGTGASTGSNALINLGGVNKAGDTMTGDLIVNSPTGTTTIRPGSIEIYATTPFIDMHYGNSTTDYDIRLINDDTSRLTIAALNAPSGLATVKAGSYRSRGGILGVATTDEQMVYDFSVNPTTSDLQLARSRTAGSFNLNAIPIINALTISFASTAAGRQTLVNAGLSGTTNYTRIPINQTQAHQILTVTQVISTNASGDATITFPAGFTTISSVVLGNGDVGVGMFDCGILNALRPSGFDVRVYNNGVPLVGSARINYVAAGIVNI